MTSDSSKMEPMDPKTVLAEERTEMATFRSGLAVERTTLAWIRTTLGMTSFGLGMIGFFDRCGSTRRPQKTFAAMRLRFSLALRW